MQETPLRKKPRGTSSSVVVRTRSRHAVPTQLRDRSGQFLRVRHGQGRTNSQQQGQHRQPLHSVGHRLLHKTAGSAQQTKLWAAVVLALREHTKTPRLFYSLNKAINQRLENLAGHFRLRSIQRATSFTLKQLSAACVRRSHDVHVVNADARNTLF